MSTIASKLILRKKLHQILCRVHVGKTSSVTICDLVWLVIEGSAYWFHCLNHSKGVIFSYLQTNTKQIRLVTLYYSNEHSRSLGLLLDIFIDIDKYWQNMKLWFFIEIVFFATMVSTNHGAAATLSKINTPISSK